MMAHGCGEVEGGPSLVVICGCYKGRGLQILEDIAAFLRDNGFNAWTVHQLCPVPPNASSEEKRQASRKVLREAMAIIFVVLSHRTLGIPLETDITGGWAFEEGMLYEWSQQGLSIPHTMFLYDGAMMLRQISQMLPGMGTGWEYEAYAEQGNLTQLKDLALHLCRRAVSSNLR